MRDGGHYRQRRATAALRWPRTGHEPVWFPEAHAPEGSCIPLRGAADPVQLKPQKGRGSRRDGAPCREERRRRRTKRVSCRNPIEGVVERVPVGAPVHYPVRRPSIVIFVLNSRDGLRSKESLRRHNRYSEVLCKSDLPSEVSTRILRTVPSYSPRTSATPSSRRRSIWSRSKTNNFPSRSTPAQP